MEQAAAEQKQLNLYFKKYFTKNNPDYRTNKMIQNIVKDDNYFPQLQSYLPNQDSEVKIQCLKYMKYECFTPNTPVFNIDEKGEKFYLILSGIVGVYIRKNKDDNALLKVKELFTGQGFGELALINNKLRSASIICHTNVHLASLEKSKFNIALKSIEQQKLQQNLINLTKIPYFSNWNEINLKQIFHCSFKQSFHKNEHVFIENQETNSVYIILEGEFMQSKCFKIPESDQQINSKLAELKKNFIISETHNHNTKNIQITIMQKNELFGEEDIIEQNDKRSYSVSCLSMSGEVIMIKQKDFQRIMMSDVRTKQLIEKRLAMKNLVRNARITNIAAQLEKQQNRELINLTPRRAEIYRNSLLQNGQKSNFQEEYKLQRTEAEKMFQKKEEQRQEESQENKRDQQANEKFSVSPKFSLKKKVQKDIMIKGFQEQLKLNMVKKFNTLQIQRFQNHIPPSMIENIDTDYGDYYKKLNLKQQHNKDIRLTEQQKEIYQKILKKRQIADQVQKSQDQKTFTHLVSCTSFDNLNKSNSFYFNGSLSTRESKTPTSNQRFSAPEVFLKKSFSPKYSGYYKFDQNMNQSNNSNPNLKQKPLFTNSNQLSPHNNINILLLQSNTVETQTPSPQSKESLSYIPSTVYPSPYKSENILVKKDGIKLQKCSDLEIKPIKTQDSDIFLSSSDIITETPKGPIKYHSTHSKSTINAQSSYYNNFFNPYRSVISQSKKKREFEEKIKQIVNQQQKQSGQKIQLSSINLNKTNF